MNWFGQGGKSYARFRPTYPASLAGFLADLAPSREAAVDVGCGNGQLTGLLSAHFEKVTGLDPSADQLAHAAPHGNVRYVRAPAERMPLADASVHLITAAQAAHWFELPAFYGEVRRIAVDQAVLTLISYGVLQLDADLQGRFNTFYREEIDAFWPPERKLVDAGYAGLDFPFAERPVPAMEIHHRWDLGGLLGYISTWSAVRQVEEAGATSILKAFADDLTALWGEPARKRPMTWPIKMRVGTVLRRAPAPRSPPPSSS